jgi:hypothetical protein
MLAEAASAGGAGAWTPTGTTLWLKADAIVGLVDGDAVATWIDSGGANNCTQVVVVSQPVYKTGILNALPVVRFTGAFHDMNEPSLAHRTVLAVASFSAAGFTEYHGLIGGAVHIVTGVPATTNLAKGLDAVTAAYKDGTAIPFVGGGYDWAPLSGSYWLLSWILTATVTQAGLIGRTSGGGRYWTGDIAEMLVYNSALSDADRQKVEGYLAWKWGLQASLPVGHPYTSAPP